MKIDGTTFGSITIDGKTYDHDVIVRLSDKVEKRKKKLSKRVYGSSHTVSEDEAAYFGIFGGRFRSNPAGDFAAKRHPLGKDSRCPPRRVAADEVILSCRVH